MREISKCFICEPSYHCVGEGDKRRYYFPMIKDYVDSPESITDCPIFRRNIELIPVEKEKAPEKLTNYKTGETYDKL
jgi:hypothetical protein